MSTLREAPSETLLTILISLCILSCIKAVVDLLGLASLLYYLWRILEDVSGFVHLHLIIINIFPSSHWTHSHVGCKTSTPITI